MTRGALELEVREASEKVSAVITEVNKLRESNEDKKGWKKISLQLFRALIDKYQVNDISRAQHTGSYYCAVYNTTGTSPSDISVHRTAKDNGITGVTPHEFIEKHSELEFDCSKLQKKFKATCLD
ncbi:hypothetical protein FQA39_LY05292 [Lamprigera yunnana]|nr:hypothetical protein FQA39_LY05292 [Lamprigera yunnana]